MTILIEELGRESNVVLNFEVARPTLVNGSSFKQFTMITAMKPYDSQFHIDLHSPQMSMV
jgi:hypothetical protein